ncbi:MAG: diaminopimelate decarboxylase [Verrucomicrobiota bacterium JB022]|nr:diaminopimelate decarboxylase [Verrucomicrobiota bacterium JB022]
MAELFWWQRRDLAFGHEGLALAGQPLAELAEQEGTPLYVYSLARIREKVRQLQQALSTVDAARRLYYAMKSNRHPSILRLLAEETTVGIDACSPGEVRRALECGFVPERISFTGYAVSRSDWRQLLAYPGLRINCDGLSALREVGRQAPGRRLGLRLDPALGVGYRGNRLVEYSGTAPAKFGIRADDLPKAREIAEEHGLVVEGLHCHAGCGYLGPQLEQWSTVLACVASCAAAFPALRYVNLGGGLGTPRQQGDERLDLAVWAEVVQRHFGGRGLEICFEPGDFLVKDAGVLILEVASIDHKAGVTFVGLNGGFNLHPEPAYYDLPLPAVPVAPREGAWRAVTLTGNINEALDVWARDLPMPPLEIGDRVALLHAGGYGAAMSSQHCLRGEFSEYVLP